MPITKDVMTSIFAIAVGASPAAAGELKPSSENLLYGGNVTDCSIAPSKTAGEKKTLTCQQDGETKKIGITEVVSKRIGGDKAEIGLGVKNDVVTSYITIGGMFMAAKSENCSDIRSPHPEQGDMDMFGLNSLSAKVCGPNPRQ